MLAGQSARPGTTLNPGRIHLHPTAAKEGSVSRPISAQALHSISGFTYILPQSRRAVLAGHSAPKNYTSSRSDSLTSYRSERRQC